MKPHLTQAVAVLALLLAAVVVTYQMRAEPESEDSDQRQLSLQERKRLEQRRDERKTERLAIRGIRGKRGEPPSSLTQMTDLLVKEFPNLQEEPPLPIEKNCIAQLHELANEIDPRTGKSFISELTFLMDPDGEWSPQAAEQLLKEHAEVIAKLMKISGMKPGSHTRTGGIGPLLGESHSGMLFLDLLRLKSRLHMSKDEVAASIVTDMDARALSHLIEHSEGASIRDLMIAKYHRQKVGDAATGLDIFEKVFPNNLGIHHRGHLVSPYWGDKMNSSMLTHAIRRSWTLGLINDDDPFVWRLEITDVDAASAYARYHSELITLINRGDHGLLHILTEGFPSLRSGNLAEDQHQLILEKVEESHGRLNQAIRQGLAQHQIMTGIKLYERLEGGDYHAGLLSWPFARCPLTNSPYQFDPETRMLSRSKQIEGYEVPPTPINKPENEGASMGEVREAAAE